MSELSIEAIKKRSDELTKEIMNKEEKKPTQIIESITKLIDDIMKLSSDVDSFDDSRWLSDTAVKWQSMLSTTFGEPRTMITSAKPKSKWFPSTPPASSLFSKEEVEIWLNIWANLIKFASLNQQDNESYCSYLAKVAFASEVLNGKINFAQRIAPESYDLLEEIWLRDVKLLIAYFEWVKDKRLFVQHDRNFYDASNHIRLLLVDDGMKAQREEFYMAKDYLQKKYIDINMSEDNKNNFTMKQGPEVHQLIEKKAHEIFETTGSTDSHRNWIYAETYVKMFYENIVPAVEENDKEKVLRVLKAFQYGRMNGFLIINCFETALAIYFLDPDIIQSLWNDSVEKPYPNSAVESIVEVGSWPRNFTVKEKCGSRFWFDATRIGFKGVMLDAEREALEKALKATTSGELAVKHVEAIKRLYDQSRLIHKETTF